MFSYERHKDDLRSTEFNRLTAWELLPEANPFLRRLSQDISLRSPIELGDELTKAEFSKKLDRLIEISYTKSGLEKLITISHKLANDNSSSFLSSRSLF